MRLPSPRRQTIRHLLGASLAIVLAGGLLGWSRLDARHAQTEREQTLGALRQLEKTRQQASAEAAELAHQWPLFQRLRQSGLTGPADRPAWSGALRTLHRELHLPALKYEFSPPVPLPGPNQSRGPLVSSAVHLQLGLAHEADLLHFLDQLAQRVRALSVIRQCRLWRDSGRGLNARLGADCTIDWITLEQTPSP